MYGSRFKESVASPTKFEKDQKDQLIAQLKAENQQLRQSDREYQELAQHLKSLEHRYKLLYDEKSKNESEFKTRNENSIKTIT